MHTFSLIQYHKLHEFCLVVFEKIGYNKEEAIIATKNLLKADLRGIDSHGIARLSGYIRLWENDRANTQAQPSIIHETPSTATVDGDKGLGLVVGDYAIKIAIEKAKAVGTGWVAVKNSNHFGIAGNYVMMCLKEDMIGVAMTNASALTAPTFSKDKMLGTNPIAVAFPAGEEAPFIADFATTTAANGKLEILQRSNQPMPTNWAQDADGGPTNDPHILKKSGALLPLGSTRELGGHKGYALGSIVDIFSGVLSGANFGPWVPPFPAYVPMPENMPGEGIGHFFGAMRVDAFQSVETFKKSMDQWLRTFRNARPINMEKQVLVAGDPERAFEKERLENGIPIMDIVLEDLKSIASKFNITASF